MPGGEGSLNQLGCPTIDIEVSGPLEQFKRSFTALVDTGFSGFLSLPMVQAFPLGLILHGTTTVILADGTRQSKFTCLGDVTFGDQSEVGTIIIEPDADEALVGMEFLKKFKLALLTDADTGSVFLFGSDFIKQALEAAKAKPPS
jgi:clan AA aspartic protease